MYIVESDSQNREHQAIRHVAGSFLKTDLLLPFGFDDLSFVIVEAQKPKLTPGIVGDVDILVGNLDFKDWSAYRKALSEMEAEFPDWPHLLRTQLAGKKVAEANGLKWPPEPVRVAGVEVKCAYYTDRLKASKSSDEKVSGIRSQIDWLERMGLDQVGLLDVVGNEPAYQEDGGFFGAMGRANRSLETMRDVLAARLPEDTAAGQFVWSAGAVGGGDEGIRGAGAIHLLRAPAKNPRLAAGDPETVAHRAALAQNIPRLLENVASPKYFPVVFIDCRSCGRVHYLDDRLCAL